MSDCTCKPSEDRAKYSKHNRHCPVYIMKSISVLEDDIRKKKRDVEDAPAAISKLETLRKKAGWDLERELKK